MPATYKLLAFAQKMVAGALERSPHQFRFVCGSLKGEMTFANYDRVCFHSAHSPYSYASDLTEVAAMLNRAGILKMPSERFQVCWEFFQQGVLPEEWELAIAAIVVRRRALGLSPTLDLVSPMQELIKNDSAFRAAIAAAGHPIDDKNFPLYTNRRELKAMLAYCLLNAKVADKFVETAAAFSPSQSAVDYKWIARAVGYLFPAAAGLQVYDLGCGSGRGLAQIATANPHSQCVGYEFQTWPMLHHGEYKMPANLQLRNEDVRYITDARVADVCILAAVLGHATPKAGEQLVLKAHSLLKSGGILICAPQVEGEFGSYWGQVGVFQKTKQGFADIKDEGLSRLE